MTIGEVQRKLDSLSPTVDYKLTCSVALETVRKLKEQSSEKVQFNVYFVMYNSNTSCQTYKKYNYILSNPLRMV